MDSKKKTTITDIARECGVSITVVSRVLNGVPGYCSKATEQRVLETVRRLNYRPNQVARSLVKQKTKLVAVLIPDIFNRFFQELYQGIETVLSEKGYKILLCDTLADEQRERDYIDDLSTGVVDGIIASTLNGIEDNAKLLELHRQHFPLILVERYGDDVRDIERILFENRLGLMMAVDTLYEKGHRRIAYLGGPAHAFNAALRLQGYRDGLKRHGIDPEEKLIRHGEYKISSGYEMMRDLLKTERFTAFAAANDLLAIGACKAIRETGLRVPEDISAIGFDGTMLAGMHQPPLSTIVVNGAVMGQKAAERLIHQIEDKSTDNKDFCLMPSLRDGGSIRTI